MVKLTQSLSVWLLKYHRDLYVPISFGHLEDFTDELKQEYLKWCLTDEGKSYLNGGSNYDKAYAERIGFKECPVCGKSFAYTDVCPICNAELKAGDQDG